MIYYILLLAVTVLIGIPLCRIKHGKLIYCIICGIIFFLFAGVRWYVGTDFYSYRSIFIRSIEYSVDELMFSREEKGFLMPMKLIGDYFPDYSVVIMVIAFCVAAAVMTYIYKKCERPYLGVFFFLTFGIFFNSLNFMRQVLAACILLYGMRYIKQGQFLRYTAVVLFASCLHISALIMIPFYFILRIKMNYITLGVYAGISVVYMIFSHDILDFITDYIYKSYDPDLNRQAKLGLNPDCCIYFGVLFIAAFILRKKLIEKDEENSILLNCLFFTFFFELTGVKHAILSRFTILFYIPAAVVFMPRVTEAICEKVSERFRKDRKKFTVARVLAAASVIAVCTGMYIYFIMIDYNSILPYRTIINWKAGG